MADEAWQYRLEDLCDLLKDASGQEDDGSLGDELYALLDDAYQQDPARCAEEIAPLLQAHPTLKLSFTGANTLRRMATHPLTPRTWWLVLDHQNHRLRDDDARAIAESPALEHASALMLGDNSLRNPGVHTIVTSPHLASGRLRELSLWGNAFGAPAVRAVVTAPWASKLRALDLGSNHIGLDGVSILANAPTLASLERLDLWGCNIGDGGARKLIASTHLRELSWLELSQNQLSEGVVEALRARFGEALRV